MQGGDWGDIHYLYLLINRFITRALKAINYSVILNEVNQGTVYFLSRTAQ